MMDPFNDGRVLADGSRDAGGPVLVVGPLIAAVEVTLIALERRTSLGVGRGYGCFLRTESCIHHRPHGSCSRRRLVRRRRKAAQVLPLRRRSRMISFLDRLYAVVERLDQ